MWIEQKIQLVDVRLPALKAKDPGLEVFIKEDEAVLAGICIATSTSKQAFTHTPEVLSFDATSRLTSITPA
ncbi:hypothetical protein RvY_11747 [Ramazzottius varieornatus]|uniref:Uncharacterized protein n=1 Tax=Ramazzottius varieornatus TaxID=947166 RepID=A0A1D1VMI6_RAMVA|nr:hypothetical protein RvY_11747 [Ramazzottius varieornatus]